MIEKIQPQATDIEDMILGTLLTTKDAILQLNGVLKTDMFYKSANQKIFECIIDLSDNSQPIDILTVKNQLDKNKYLDEVGGAFYLAQLSQMSSGVSIEHHAKIIAQKYMQRELIRISNELNIKSYDSSVDVFELISDAESQIMQLSSIGEIKKHTSYAKELPKFIERIEQIRNKEIDLIGISSGFLELDRITNGFQQPDLIILAARPGAGKTTFALNIAKNVCTISKKKVAVFSLEMSSYQLVMKIASMETEIPLNNFMTGKTTEYEMNQLKEAKKNSPKGLLIDDTPALSLFDFKNKCRRLKKQNGIQLVIVDYLQLMTCQLKNSDNREREISKISAGLKAVAKELELPIIALSQLSRDVEKRGGNKKPQLSDLRESGSIEQDADIVMFLFSPEYYNQTSYEYNGETFDAQNLISLTIAKHRNGRCSEILLNFKREISKFYDFNKIENAYDPLKFPESKSEYEPF